MSLLKLLRRPTASLRFIPEVDGLRFAAISWVVFHHFYLVFCTVYPDAEAQLPYWVTLAGSGGYKGVQLFFVLSGFILAIPFIRRFEAGKGPMPLGAFYKRRLIRIEAPYAIAMTICLLLVLRIHLFTPSVALKHYLVSLGYMHNIVYASKSWINGVAWSLEVEIQFYLLAPLMFRVFKLQKRPRRWIITAGMALLLAIQAFYYPSIQSLYLYLPYFLLGMLLADWYTHGWPALFRYKVSIWLLLPALLLAIWVPVRQAHRLDILLLAAILVLFTLVLTRPLLRRAASLPWITAIGGMCYSIYLTHAQVETFALYFTKRLTLPGNDSLHFLVQWILIGTIVLCVGIVYYLLIEKPFMILSMKHRLTDPVSKMTKPS